MPGETLLLLRVKPQARRAELVGWHGDALKLSVRSAPERGRANDEVRALVAAALGLLPGAIVLESGATSQDKRVRVHGLEPEEVARRLEAALAARPKRRDATDGISHE